MVRKLTLSLLAVVALLSGVNVNAQDAEFSQFYAAPLYLNPAFAGTAGAARVGLNYRNQWPGLNNAFVQYAFSYDQNIEALGGGIGLFVMSDNQAKDVFTSVNASLMYAYELRVGDNAVIKPALKVSYLQNAFNGSSLIYRYDNQGNPNPQGTGEPAYNDSKNVLDFGAGGLFFSELFYAGIAVDHLTEPNVAFGTTNADSKLPMKITAHAGSVLPVGGRGSKSSISPNLLYQQQGPASQLNAGLYYNFGAIVLGGWYRYVFVNPDAFIASIGLKAGKFRVGYSYDLTTSELKSASQGAHEISLYTEFNTPKKRAKNKQWQRINCPAF